MSPAVAVTDRRPRESGGPGLPLARNRGRPLEYLRPWVPACEDVTQFTLGKTVLSICLQERTAGGNKQPFIARINLLGYLSTEIKNYPNFRNSSRRRPIEFTSSCVGTTVF